MQRFSISEASFNYDKSTSWSKSSEDEENFNMLSALHEKGSWTIKEVYDLNRSETEEIRSNILVNRLNNIN